MYTCVSTAHLKDVTQCQDCCSPCAFPTDHVLYNMKQCGGASEKEKIGQQHNPAIPLLVFFFFLEYSCFIILCQFILYSKVNQLYIHIFTLFFGFPSHLGHQTALSRVPCAIQQVLISYLFYIQYQQCIYVNTNLPIYPTPTPRLGIHTFVPYVCLFLLCK